MSIRIRRILFLTRLMTVAAIAATLIVMGISMQTAHALNTIVVTTTGDVTNPADGVTSLREAFAIANTDGDDTVIQLAADESYQLTQCDVSKMPEEPMPGIVFPPDDDDANLDGDLDHTATDDLRIEGNGSTIENTCEWDRVIHNLDNSNLLEIVDVTVSGGRNPPEDGTNIYTRGALSLDQVSVINGLFTAFGNHAAVAAGDVDASGNQGLLLTMADSTVLGNGKGGVRVRNGDATVTGSGIFDSADGPGLALSFGTLMMDTTTIVDNNGHGVSGIDSAVTITNSSLGGNSGFGVRNTGNAASGYDLELTNVNVIDNAGGGVDCSYCTAVTLTNSRVQSNDGTGVAMLTNVTGPTMTISNSSILDNESSTGAGGIDFEVTEDALPPTVTITRSTVAGNAAAPGVDGGGIRLDGTGLSVEHSTITGNSTTGTGGGVYQTGSEPVTFSFVTLVENSSAFGAANLATGNGSLMSTASVIALPSGGLNCSDAGGATISGGFNQVDDMSCGLTGGTGDVESAPNPQLGPLSPNGGPTPTRLPLMGSPLLGAITGEVCDNAGDDQRGISRPQGPACETGAVEENETFLAVMLMGKPRFGRSDRILRDWLRERGYEVVGIDDDQVRRDQSRPEIKELIAEAELVLVSPTVQPQKIGDVLNSVTAPIINTQGLLSDDIGLALESGETKQRTAFVTIEDPGAPYGGRVRVFRRPSRMAYGVPVEAASVVARAAVQGSPAVVYWVASGAELADGTPAPGPRGAFLFSRQGLLRARHEAFVLLDYLLNQLTGN